MFIFRYRCLNLIKNISYLSEIRYNRKTIHLNAFFMNDNKSESSDENSKQREDNEKALKIRGAFEHITNKNRQTYIDMVQIFVNKDVHRRGHVEFIYSALKNMEDFGVHRDIEVYKALIDVLPKGKFIPTNLFQAEFMHYPKQQQCIIDLLEQMEEFGVMPDYEMEDLLLNIFGRRGHPVRKYWRMMYWMPKFKNLSPWPVPNPPPDDAMELAKLAVERMCSVDIKSEIKIYNTNELENSLDDTWIISGQSPEQKDLLNNYKNESIYIEGPFLIWLRNKCLHYFILKGDARPKLENIDEEDPDDVSRLKVFKLGQGYEKSSLVKKPSIHEQDDGVIFAICVTGISTKDSLLSWVRFLENDNNPKLATIPVLFKLRSSVTTSKELVTMENKITNLK